MNLSNALKQLAKNTRASRLQLNLTQKGLAERSGVPLPTLRKFEQKGLISLEAFLKLHLVLGDLARIVEATEGSRQFSSMDEVLAADSVAKRKRGQRK